MCKCINVTVKHLQRVCLFKYLTSRAGADVKPPFIVMYINREGSKISRPISNHDLINELCLKTADN